MADTIHPNRSYMIGPHQFEAAPLDPALYLVATPIGQLKDITIRAIEVLAAADVLACEDTRVSRVLLDRYGIMARPYAYHEHNAQSVGPKLISALQKGKSVALISDAGTPLVSDPGYRLAVDAVANGLTVIPVPGASAVMAALCGAGLPTDRFTFVGFLPQKAEAARKALEDLKPIRGTLILFEAPGRTARTLALAADVLGPDRPATVARELTKMHEEFARGTLSNLSAEMAERTLKGEVVIVIGEGDRTEMTWTETAVDTLLMDLAKGQSASRAAAEAANMTGLKKPDLYRRLMELKP